MYIKVPHTYIYILGSIYIYTYIYIYIYILRSYIYIYIYIKNLYIYIYKDPIYIYISYIYIYISCHAASTDFPDPLSPLLPIVHRLWQVFRATSRILTQLLNVCSSWSSCFCPAICAGPLEYIPYELVPASPAVSRMSGLSNLDSFRDGRLVAV